MDTPPKVLIIGGNPGMVCDQKAALQAGGYEVISFSFPLRPESDANESSKPAAAFIADIIVVNNCSLAAVKELSAQLRSIKRTPDIPVLVLAASPNEVEALAVQLQEFDVDILPDAAAEPRYIRLVVEQVLKHRTSASSVSDLARSNQELREVNRKLQDSVGEAHHRVKNSLQNVISLLNLQSRKTGTLSAEQIRKLSSHVHGLAVLHDLLRANPQSGVPVSAIPIDRVFERLTSVLVAPEDATRVETSFESAYVAPRRASSLAVVFIELVSNALKHGKGQVRVILETQGESALFRVENEGSRFPEDFSLSSSSRGGLALLRLLCTTDLEAEPFFENSADGWARVAVTFSLSADDPEHRAGSGPSRSAEVVQ